MRHQHRAGRPLRWSMQHPNELVAARANEGDLLCLRSVCWSFIAHVTVLINFCLASVYGGYTSVFSPAIGFDNTPFMFENASNPALPW